MARTEISTQLIERLGLTASYTAAAADGHYFIQDGRHAFIHVVNGGVGATVVTIETPYTNDTLAIDDRTVSVPAGEERMIGPWPKETYGRQTNIDTSVQTSVTYAALSVKEPTRIQSYTGKVHSYNPMVYWRLNEILGTTAENYMNDSGFDGTYTNVTLNSSTGPDGLPVGLWDSGTDRCNIYSADLAALSKYDEGTAMVWLKVSGAGIWTDATLDIALKVASDASTTNGIGISKQTASNELYVERKGGGDVKNVTISTSSTDWMCVGLTWSIVADELKAYFNGAQSGATQTGLTAATNNDLDSTRAVIGAQTSTGNFNWEGYIAHLFLLDHPLSSDAMLDLYRT